MLMNSCFRVRKKLSYLMRSSGVPPSRRENGCWSRLRMTMLRSVQWSVRSLRLEISSDCSRRNGSSWSRIWRKISPRKIRFNILKFGGVKLIFGLNRDFLYLFELLLRNNAQELICQGNKVLNI